MPNAYVMFTDWSMLGHQESKDLSTALFTGSSLAIDEGGMQRDLGIGFTSADWEVDMWQPRQTVTFVLGFNRHFDVAGLAARLTRLGYHANGSIFTSPLDRQRMWTYPLRNIGINANRRLLIGGPDATAVRAALAGSGNPLGHAGSVTPLLALAAARLGRIATASIVVGSAACVTPIQMLGLHATPAAIAALRRQFTGTFTRQQAEITALSDPADTTALDALTFPDQGAAQANKASRSAVGKKMVNETGIRVTGSAVTDRVLSFTLSAGKPADIVQAAQYDQLGVDICK